MENEPTNSGSVILVKSDILAASPDVQPSTNATQRPRLCPGGYDRRIVWLLDLEKRTHDAVGSWVESGKTNPPIHVSVLLARGYVPENRPIGHPQPTTNAAQRLRGHRAVLLIDLEKRTHGQAPEAPFDRLAG